MQRSRFGFLFPPALFLLAGVPAVTLLSASAPAPVATAVRGEPETTEAAALEPVLPWEPLSRPGVGIPEVKEALSARSHLEALEALAADENAPRVARGLASFAAGLEHAKRGRGDAAVRRFTAEEVESTEIEGYALFQAARELEARRPDDAIDHLRKLIRRHPDLAVLDEARLLLATLLAKRGHGDEALAELRTVAASRDEKRRGEALADLGRLHAKRKEHQEAVDVLETLYYEMPLHAEAAEGGRLLTRLRDELPELPPTHFYRLGLRRAEILLEERQYGDAYQAFASLGSRFRDVADHDLLQLRMGVCRYRRRQITASLQNFEKVERQALLPEALFYRAEVSRRLRRTSDFIALVERLVAQHPRSPWTEEAVYSLARHYDAHDEPERALAYYRQVAETFPRGENALSSRWRVHWHSYRAGAYEEAAKGFELAAREQPASDESSRFLYWAGRAYQDAGNLDRAEGLFRQVLLGYQNTYYGRRAFEHLTALHGQEASLAAVRAAREGIDLSDALVVEREYLARRIAQLHAVGLDARAIAEAEGAVRGFRDDSAFLAIEAWIHASRGNNLEVFRTLQKAFPFHNSATGDLLPREIWKLLYPLDYWEPVQTYAAERGLDPFLVAALIRQESTFNPRVRSRAGARGLMQIIPSTGRLLARQERRRYDVRDLYNPEINVRYGTRYLKDVLGRFEGRVDYALASYNAGPHRVRRWTGMDMSIDPDVFIEEIPFQETRLYVKLVLRNEMLYRRLYGELQHPAAAQ